jgi:hypothetical protein
MSNKSVTSIIIPEMTSAAMNLSSNTAYLKFCKGFLASIVLDIQFDRLAWMHLVSRPTNIPSKAARID